MNRLPYPPSPLFGMMACLKCDRTHIGLKQMVNGRSQCQACYGTRFEEIDQPDQPDQQQPEIPPVAPMPVLAPAPAPSQPIKVIIKATVKPITKATVKEKVKPVVVETVCINIRKRPAK